MSALLAALLLLVPAPAVALPVALPNFLATPTLRSIADGDWASVSTWDAGRLPAPGDRARVTHKIGYRRTDGHVAVLQIAEGGTLTMAPDAATRLKVGTLVVRAWGTLSIVHALEHATTELIVADQPLDLVADPEQWGTGVLVESGGTIEVHGVSRLPTWVRLAVEPKAGDTTLTVAADERRTGVPSTWRIGDVAYVPTTAAESPGDLRAGPRPTQNEERRIIGITGAILTLDRPLTFDHPGAREDGIGAPVILAHVANLTRSITFRSENPDGTRGHVAFTGAAWVSIQHACFRDLGRTLAVPQLDDTLLNSYGQVEHLGTNQRGRYALHSHHLWGPTGLPASQPQFLLRGNCVRDSRKHGIVVHASHDGLIEENVVVRAYGAGVIGETGEERNTFRRNFSWHNVGSGEPPYGSGRKNTDTVHAGHAFWFAGPDNVIIDNVGGNSTRAAFAIATFNVPDVMRVPAFKGADPHHDGLDFRPKRTPIREFARNEVYGGSEMGLELWEINASQGMTPADLATVGGESRITDFKVWGITDTAVFSRYVANIVIDGLTVIGPPTRNNVIAVGGKHRLQHGVTVRRLRASSCAVGVEVPDLPGVPGTVPPPYRVEDSELRCVVGVSRSTLNEGIGTPPNALETLPLRRVELVRVKITPTNFAIRPEPVTKLKAIQSTVLTGSRPALGINAVQRDELIITDEAGAVSRVYFSSQAPSALVPQSRTRVKQQRAIVGAPEPGLTNVQALAKYGLAVGGAIAPCATTRPGVDGFVCAVAVEPPPPPPPPPVPPPDVYTLVLLGFEHRAAKPERVYFDVMARALEQHFRALTGRPLTFTVAGPYLFPAPQPLPVPAPPCPDKNPKHCWPCANAEAQAAIAKAQAEGLSAVPGRTLVLAPIGRGTVCTLADRSGKTLINDVRPSLATLIDRFAPRVVSP